MLKRHTTLKFSWNGANPSKFANERIFDILRKSHLVIVAVKR